MRVRNIRISTVVAATIAAVMAGITAAWFLGHASTSFFMVSLCVALVLLPTRYDPAIRLKEWTLDRQDGKG